MAAPLEYKRRVRMPDPEDPPMPRARRSPVIAVGLLAWLASVAVAWGVNAGTIPVANWLESGPDPVRAQAPRRAPRPAPAPLPRQSDLIATIRPEPEPTPAAEPEPTREPTATLTDEPPVEYPARQATLALPEARPAAATTPDRALDEPTPRAPIDVRPAPAESPSEAPTNALRDPGGGGASDGVSCEAAAAAANDEIRIGGDRGPADLSAADYARVLNRGGYLAGCGVPERTSVDVCAAVRNGRAVGVTVRLTPRSANVERCVARAVRRLSFPSHPRLDVARTRFAAD